MNWPLWFVIGLAIIAALATIIYSIWLNRIAHYRRFLLDNEKITVLAEVRLDDKPVGYLTFYRSTDPVPHQQLTAKMIAAAEGCKVYHLPVSKEPGYNTFRTYHKNKEQFLVAYREWSTSLFHALMAPIEIVLRFTVFPLWTMIDLVSHDHRTAAGILFLPDIGSEERDIVIAAAAKNVSVVETYDELYIKTEEGCDDAQFVF